MQNEDIRYEEGGLVAKAYEEDNYIIRRYENDSNTVAVYFSSNGIYYPNTEEQFRKRIFEENRYDWLRLGLKDVHTEVFFRDVYKQYYVAGCSRALDSVDRIADFIGNEILTGSDRLVTVGNSAGGYMAFLIGTLLHADMVFDFSGQFDLTGDVEKEFLLKKYRDDDLRSRYYNLANLKAAGYTFPDTYYFYSGLCEADKYQSELMKKADDGHIRMFEFNTATHERTMFVFNLPVVMGKTAEELNSLYSYYKGRRISRTGFSIRVCGISGTVSGGLAKAAHKLRKR